MSIAWYVLNSKPRKENLLWQQLKELDLETFYPRLHVNPVNPRSRKVRPYFPGYLFVNVDLSEFGFSKIAWVPGLKRIVAFDGKPGSRLYRLGQSRFHSFCKTGSGCGASKFQTITEANPKHLPKSPHKGENRACLYGNGER